MALEVVRAGPNDQRLLAALPQLNELLRALSGRARALSRQGLKEVLAQRQLRYLAAWDGDHLMGVTLLFIKQQNLDTKADIEEVVVSPAAQGQGVGSALMEKAEVVAREEGVTTIYLTSNPRRIAANAMYQRRGYERYDTNVYRLAL